MVLHATSVAINDGHLGESAMVSNPIRIVVCWHGDNDGDPEIEVRDSDGGLIHHNFKADDVMRVSGTLPWEARDITILVTTTRRTTLMHVTKEGRVKYL